MIKARRRGSKHCYHFDYCSHEQYTSYDMARVFFTDGESAEASGQTQELASNGEGADATNLLSGTVSSMQISMIALIAWVVVMTVALVTLSIVMYRRHRQSAGFDMQSVSGVSESPSDLNSEFEAEDSVTAENETGGQNNRGFSSDDATTMPASELCQVHASITPL